MYCVNMQMKLIRDFIRWIVIISAMGMASTAFGGPRGVKVWFCDPYCSAQKPHIERFHNDLRRILQKGTSFDPLTQEQKAEMNAYKSAAKWMGLW